jgi:N-acetyl-anhydromuramyl-L-alanine amidase AmpD
MQSDLRIKDVRSEMPNFTAYKNGQKEMSVSGIAIHHAGIANPVTGMCTDNAFSIFQYHVERLGWDHGGYHYLVHPNGVIEYALDVAIPAYHAGSYWNNRYLAICLLGWFDRKRALRGNSGRTLLLPEFFSRPTAAQYRALLDLIQKLRGNFNITLDGILGHRELTGCQTACPGGNFDLDALRNDLRNYA